MLNNIRAAIFGLRALAPLGRISEVPSPDAVSFIGKLHKAGVRTALYHPGSARFPLARKLSPSGLFEATVARGKSHTDESYLAAVQRAAERLGVHPFNCVVFTRCAAAARAAATAGMKCIGLGDAADIRDAADCVRKYAEIDVASLIETGRKSTIEPKPWSVVETEPSRHRATYWESVFALCNGYVGLRGTHEEPYDNTHPGLYVNRFFETEPLNMRFPQKDSPTYRTTMVNLPDARLMELTVDGERFDLFEGNVSEYSRELDLKRGTVTRSLVWRTRRRKRVRIRTTRLVSMTRRHSAVIRYEVTPLNFSGNVTLRSSIRDESVTGWIWRKCTRIVDNGDVDGALHYLVSRTDRSSQAVAMVCGHVVGGSGRQRSTARSTSRDDTWTYEIDLSVAKGRTVRVDKHLAVVSTWEAPEEDLADRALAVATRDMNDGFKALAAEQKAFWQRHWDTADIEIGGCPADQQALRFVMYQLRQNHPDDPLRSISATGLTGDNYFGMVFWDTEMLMLPYFLYNEPELAKSLLMYRCRHLDAARQRAEAMGGPGACFPWSTIDGLEANADTLVSYAQYHINCDVAYGIWRYWLATGDNDFLYDHGAEVLFETARFMADLGAFVPLKGDRFCINFVTGPDEYNYAVNNNCYTNGMTQFLFEFAAGTYERMKQDRPDALKALRKRTGLKAGDVRLWRRCAEAMYIPFNEDLGIHEQDDTYLYRDPVDVRAYPQNYEIKNDMSLLQLGRLQVTKQADVILLMLILGDRFSREVKQANYDFYEPRTTHASSLSPAAHSIAAAELGRGDEMYRFFRQAAFLDLYDFKGNTPEGVHFACAGGTWMAVVNGFAGLRDWDGGISFAPRLPDAWSSYRFTLLLRGRLVEIRVTRTGATFTLLKGKAMTFTSAGRDVRLSKAAPKARTPLACAERDSHRFQPTRQTKT
ncbi:MAG: glycoside hydrolase family 65 protein [Phycisphaerae bacterium]|nr:glycoside hydrolase family 65 protein [Phycisphaerae bacterium]